MVESREQAGTSAEVRPEIASSWRRAELFGVDRASLGPLHTAEVDHSSRLMVAAEPVLCDLAERLAERPFALMLADRDCRIVHQWTGQRSLRTELTDNGITIGSVLDESAAGTNALGTPFELGRGMAINGVEHYLHALQRFSCYGQPIRHPLTRRVEGILDITMAGSAASPLFGPLLAGAAQEIEARIVEGARAADRRLFLAFQAATRQRRTPVVVLGGDVVLATRGCLERLGSADPAVLRSLLAEVVSQGPVSRVLDLGGWGRVRVQAEPVAGTPDGAVFHLGDLLPAPRSSGARGRSTGSGAGATTLVAGEPGTGRSTVAGQLIGEQPFAALDAVGSITGPERDWVHRLTEAAGSGRALVVEDVQVLGERLCAVLRATLAAARGPVVLTSCPVDELPTPVARLVARCAGRVELAPLRERPHELPTLLATIGSAVLPGRELRFSPRALDCLAGQPWPGNLVELTQLVEGLATRPLAGRIDVADLPARYRGNGRTSGLGGRDRAERLAIIVALGNAQGNKACAARALGISRTTLYRRMRTLDVPDR